MLLGNKEPISIYSILTIFSLMLSGTPIDISDAMLSIGIDVLLFVIEKFAISVVSR
jgi:hypothetical protein